MAGPDSTIVILTGAGISAESGLPTFRGADGLWEGHRVEEVATPEAFAKNPNLVQKFYNERRRKLLSPEIRPNAAHLALARLDAEWPGDVLLVTQNVDNLHERAGSRNVLHMHGKLLEVRCTTSGKVFDWLGDVEKKSLCACCGKSGTLRPNIVWFGEMPTGLDEIFQALDRCSVFLSVGTSGQVYPAAGFAQHVAMREGVRSVELNLERSVISRTFTEGVYGKATDIVPTFVESLLR
jgi:NAD-dependent deacetylase